MPFTPTNVGDVTPRTGRDIWNANDQGIATVANGAEAGVATANTNLNNHKTSADHDGRYYTEAEIDAAFATHRGSGDHDTRYYTEAEVNNLIGALVSLSGNQNVDGLKTFLQTITIKNANGIEFRDTNGSMLGAIRCASLAGSPVTRLEVDEGGLVRFMECIAGNGKVFFDRPIEVNGERLATEDFVIRVAQSGHRTLGGQTNFIQGPNGSSYTIVEGGENQVFCIPNGLRVINMQAVGIANGLIVFNENFDSLVDNRAVMAKVAVGSTTVTLSIHTADEAVLASQIYAQQPVGARYSVTLTLA